MASRFFDERADVGSDEEDEELDSETGDVIPRNKKNGANGRMDDSSEEEDEEEDEEALRKAGEGFIADEDEEEDEEARTAKRRERRKRRREQREDEALDDEDLELIGERIPQPEKTQSKFKRLKQGHREDRSRRERGGLGDIFADEEDEDMEDRGGRFQDQGEFEDFIVEDEEGENLRRDIEEVARPGARKSFFDASGALDTSGMDPATIEDFKQAFYGDLTYEWVLDLENEEEGEMLEADGAPITLKTIFEESQLAEKYLTEDDIAIKNEDIPERYQLLRKPFRLAERDEEQTSALLQEEAKWMFSLIWPKKSMDSRFRDPLQASIRKVLEFINLENYEIPFIFQHRKDYLIHEYKISAEDSMDGRPETKAEKMLNQDDLWDILNMDLRWKGLIEKRDALDNLYSQVKEKGIEDSMIEELKPKAATNEEMQEITDYFHFQYSAELKDVMIAEREVNGTQKRAGSTKNMWERLRSSRVYNVVRGFGISAEAFALNAASSGPRTYTEDPADSPDDMADSFIDPPEYQTGAQILRAAKAMFAEELVVNPRLRRHVRDAFYNAGQFHCYRTEKGARTITEDHRYYEFKYLRNQDFSSLINKPELYLRMLQAESEGLVNVKVSLINAQNFRSKLVSLMVSDNLSAVADAWNRLRKEVLEGALDRLEKIIAKGVKEALRTECEQRLGAQIRARYTEKLDQAPFKVAGLATGDKPRVMAFSNGAGNLNRDAICWVYVDEDGRMVENGKFVDLRPGNKEKYLPDGKDVQEFLSAIDRCKPDVIGVSGFSPETRKLYKDLQELVDRNGLEISEAGEVEDPDDRKLEVVIVNDECARLYHTSERAIAENPALPPISRYCVGLARYIQDPMLEYAALGKNITSISFDPNQDLLSADKLQKWLETAIVDMVNLVGVSLDDAVSSSYTANLLPYVCGLGPRKTDALLKAVAKNGGSVVCRTELLGVADEGSADLVPAMAIKVWQNCASFFRIDADDSEANADTLDKTRIHPEDYDIARKMAADALELDEEDIKAEVDEGGPSAVVRKLTKDEGADKVNDLVLEEYAEQLEQKFNQRKRATLETIRAELQNPFEELRQSLAPMTSEDVFAMLTGETEDSLVEGMIVPVTIRRIFQDHIECKLDNGLEGGIGAEHYPEGVGNIHSNGADPRQVYHPTQVVQAIVQYLNKRALTCQLSLRGDLLKKPFKKRHTATPGEWDEDEERRDKAQVEKEREAKSGRAQRVIKHPLFKPFSTAQAQEFLGSQSRGDCVIRPSSKGLDHLAVTWKVSDNVYQHIDVVELDKENEFALGKTLVISGKYRYSDLDEMIQLHVKSMAKKCDEMTNDERFQSGSRKETEQWLEAYVEANPRRAMYAFCINREYPGYFNLCFKPSLNVNVQTWPVKIIPGGFEMMKNSYPDMQSLKNGFKMLMVTSGGGGKR